MNIFETCINFDESHGLDPFVMFLELWCRLKIKPGADLCSSLLLLIVIRHILEPSFGWCQSKAWLEIAHANFFPAPRKENKKWARLPQKVDDPPSPLTQQISAKIGVCLWKKFSNRLFRVCYSELATSSWQTFDHCLLSTGLHSFIST